MESAAARWADTGMVARGCGAMRHIAAVAPTNAREGPDMVLLRSQVCDTRVATRLLPFPPDRGNRATRELRHVTGPWCGPE